MRFGRIRGLNDWAENLVNEERVVGVRVTIDTRDGQNREVRRTDITEPVCRKCHSGESISGFELGVVHDLQRYSFPDGIVLTEKVQKVFWKYGPIVFLCLFNQNSNQTLPESLWKDEEMKGEIALLLAQEGRDDMGDGLVDGPFIDEIPTDNDSFGG